MATAKKITGKQIKLLQVARRQLGWSQADYDAAVKERFGVASGKDLTQGQFKELLRHLEKCGFRYQGPGRVKKAPPIDRQPERKQAVLGAVAGALQRLGKEWRYADAIARKMFGIDMLAWCDEEQIRKVLAALEYKRRKDEGRPVKRRLKPEGTG